MIVGIGTLIALLSGNLESVDFANGVLWFLTLPFIFLFLVLDGITYSMVALSYKLFELMSRLNLASLTTWVGPVMERIQALIMVIVLFILGYSLINYLINPDKVNDKKVGGIALVKNIGIAAVLLIVYSYAFTLLNEVTFLVIGAPEGYNYVELNELFGVENDGSPGLISNIIFGETDASEEQADFGVSLAVNTLNIFLHDRSSYNASILSEVYRNAVENGDGNLLGITAAVTEINIFSPSANGKVEYKYPIISTAVGLYLVYTLISIAIELGIRAFKLVILQMVAPIAIITIIKDGWEAKVWKNWYKLVGTTFIDCFLRIASVYFVVAFISTAWNRIGELFDYNYDAQQGFTSYLLLILVVAAGFKFAKDLPKFIDSIFGSKLAEANKGGFGSFMKGLIGGAAGFVTGLGAGIAAKSGVAGTAWNAIRGSVNGASTVSKGKGIADTFKKVSEAGQANRTRAQNIARQGGGFRYFGANVESAMGVPQRKQAEIQGYSDTNKAIDNLMNAQAQEIKDMKDTLGIKYGESADSYAQTYAQKATSKAGITNAQSALSQSQIDYSNAQAHLNDAQSVESSAKIKFDNSQTALKAAVQKKANIKQSDYMKDSSLTDASGHSLGKVADVDAYNAAVEAAQKEIDEARVLCQAEEANYNNAKLLADEANKEFINAQSDLNSAQQNLVNAENQYQVDFDANIENGKKHWNNVADNANGASVEAARKELRIRKVSNANTITRKEMKNIKDQNKAKIAHVSSSGSVRRANRQSGFGK